MDPALRSIFEEQLGFNRENGESIDGRVFIGDTEIFPVETLNRDTTAYNIEFSNWQNETWLPTQKRRRTQLLTIGANASRYAELKLSVRGQRIVPFMGSGMCVPTGLPTWAQLLRKVGSHVCNDLSAIEVHLDAGRFEEAADAILSSTNRNLFNERVAHELQPVEGAPQAGAIRLVPKLFPDLAITSNLDPVAESMYSLCDLPIDDVLTSHDMERFRRLSAEGRRLLLKLHGDGRRPDTRVLTTAEYDRAYGAGGIAREELANLYRNRPLLFLGCSLISDRTVKLIAEVAVADPECPKHFCFLAQPSSRDDTVSRENFLTERGIYPIWYDGDHDEDIVALLSGFLEIAG